ncbi:MAG: transglutaminase-like cysteine peptidase [Desulfovibrionaceae bacterium]|nr:transglutaminase-like cysteine peptidase [Desulfovibrionaceae bacterium]
MILGRRMIQRPIDILPKWSSMLNKVQKKRESLHDASRISTYTWGKIKQLWAQLSTKEKVEKVNALFNAFPYTEDILNYGLEDYWATPKEFLSHSGDCEDYAITKFYALKDLGIPEHDMRILVLIDTIRGIGHAVLLVHYDNEIYLLDNVSELILPAKLYTHYDPQFSVDRFGVYL